MDSGVVHFSSPLFTNTRSEFDQYLAAMDSSSSSRKKNPVAADGGLVWRPHQYLPKSMRKVQVMYYLAPNSGRLQHPHYIELTLPPNHPLRLKNVLDRLVALRGSAMPSQYSWSCKRNYKAGYVWYDLGPNDIIHPSSQGPEYVLKGSQLLQDASGRFEVEEKRSVGKEKDADGVGRWILKLMACGKSNKNSHLKMETEKEDFSGSIVPPFNRSNSFSNQER